MSWLVVYVQTLHCCVHSWFGNHLHVFRLIICPRTMCHKPFNYTQISGWYFSTSTVASPHPILPDFTHFHWVKSTWLTPMHQLRPPEYICCLLLVACLAHWWILKVPLSKAGASSGMVKSPFDLWLFTFCPWANKISAVDRLAKSVWDQTTFESGWHFMIYNTYIYAYIYIYSYLVLIGGLKTKAFPQGNQTHR